LRKPRLRNERRYDSTSNKVSRKKINEDYDFLTKISEGDSNLKSFYSFLIK
jgi:hypothetical protein